MPLTRRAQFLVIFAGFFASSSAAMATPPSQEYSKSGGTPRAWQAGVRATAESTVNMANINVLTSIPLFHWSGKGPAVNFSIYHNSLAAVSLVSATSGAGFTLGTAWRVSYGGQVVSINSTTVRVIEDDGTCNEFSKPSSTWVPQTGCFDTLTYNSTTGWKVTRKDQSYRRFDPTSGRLIEEVDTFGNAVTVAYDGSDRISTVTDAAGRALTFIYNGSSQLTEVRDCLSTYRKWQFAYTSGRLTTLTDPLNNTYSFTYTTAGRIATLVDRNGKTYTHSGATQDLSIADPSPFGSQDQDFKLTSTWETTYEDGEPVLSLTDQYSTYTDRRTKVYKYDFVSFEVANDNRRVKKITDPLSYTQEFTYDSGYNRASFKNQRGKTWSYTYDSMGNRLTETDPLSNVVTYTYHSTFNKVATKTEPDTSSPSRRITTYSYNSTTGALEQIEDPLENITYFGYSGTGLMTSRTDADGVGHTFAYDSYGQPASHTVDPGSSPHLNITTYTSYDAVGRLISSTDGRGYITSFTTDDLGRVTQRKVDSAGGGLQLTTNHTYDANGNRVTTTQPGGTVTKDDYDALNRRTKMTQGYGATGFGFETTYAYDANGNLTSVTDPEGNATTYLYDDANRRTRVTDALTNQTNTTYDGAGNVVTVVNARSVTTSHYYDDLNRRTQTVVDSGSGKLNLTTDYLYGLTGGGGGCGCGGSAGYGQLNKVTDPAGKVTYYYYDLMNRRIKEVRKVSDTADNGGDSDDAITETTYDAMGRVLDVSQENGSNDYLVRSTYDAAGRLATRTIDPGSGKLNLQTAYTYDAAGNMATETTPSGNVITHTYDHANRRTATTDTIGNVDSREYDADGNLTKLYTADGRHTDYTYDVLDRVTTITDRRSKNTTFTYDKLGHELTRTDRNSHTTTTEYDDVYRKTKIIDPLSHETQFQYDAVGNLTRLRAVNVDGETTTNQDTLYEYDNANRRTHEQYPLGESDKRDYTYNADGTLATRTDQNGDVTTYTYDDLHRLTGRSYSRGGSSVSYPTTQGADSFTYDRVGRMQTSSHVQGSDTFTTSMTYDAAGRTTNLDQDGFDIDHAYAVGSSPHYVQTTYPNGRVVKHNLDARGRVASITDTFSSVTTTQAANDYDDDNRLLERAFANGTTATWTYDNEDRIATLKHHCPSCGSGSSAWDFVDLEYGRDDEGNPTYRRHNHATTTSELYTYDAADRLATFKRGTLNSGGTAITGTASETQDWSLDALGNWKGFDQLKSGTSTSEARTHNNDNSIKDITIGGNKTDFSYSPPGNLKDDGTYLYDYDCENRLTRVRLKSNSNVIGEYSYNAFGWRVLKQVNNCGGLNGTQRLIYNQAWQLIEVRAVSGGSTTVSKQFIHAGSGAQELPGALPLANTYIDDHVTMLSLVSSTWSTYWYHTDGLFNTIAMSNSSATISERSVFSPYGTAALTDSGGTSIAASAIGNTLLRQGIVRDWERIGDENRARWFSSDLGRWAQRDPAGYVDSTSLVCRPEIAHTLDPSGSAIIWPGEGRTSTGPTPIASLEGVTMSQFIDDWCGPNPPPPPPLPPYPNPNIYPPPPGTTTFPSGPGPTSGPTTAPASQPATCPGGGGS